MQLCDLLAILTILIISMNNVKKMKCDLCANNFSIAEEGFPDVLYNEIRKHKLEQLNWYCKSCVKEKDKVFLHFMHISEQVQNMQLALHAIQSSLKKINISGKPQTVCVNTRHVTDASTQSEVERCSSSSTLNCSAASGASQSSEIESEDSDSTFSDSDSDKELMMQSESGTLTVVQHSIPSSNQDMKKRVNILQKVLKTHIKIDEKEAKNCKEIAESFLQSLSSILKREERTKIIFKKFYYTGSSYEKLRIKAPTEFDVDLILNLPSYISTEIEFFATTLAYAKYKWKVKEGREIKDDSVQKFLKSTSEESYFIPAKIHSWFQSVLTKLKDKLNNGYAEFVLCKSGPAMTAKITYNGHSISIDLVPVFVHNHSALAGKQPYNILEAIAKEDEKALFLVPKECTGQEGELKIRPVEAKKSWRMNFPSAEKRLLRNIGCAKPVIKLLKLLRDKQDWKHLASYYIKTIVLHQVYKQQSGLKHWRNDNIYLRFKEALEHLEEYLKKRHLPYFFDKTYSLINKMNEDQCQNWANQINRIIRKFIADADYLQVIFDVKV